SGAGSLRQAILDAEASVGTLDTIQFNISGSRVHTIAPASALPTITDPVIIDGTTQPGYAGAPLIEIAGSAASIATGLSITGGGSTIRGLTINRFTGNAISITVNGGNLIERNFLGPNPAGTSA